MNDSPALSVVIPLYRAAEGLEAVVAELAVLPVEGGLEIVLVDDASPDDTLAVCRRIVETCPVPVTVAALARNFGEHAAVMTGLRQARGQWVVTMDDDGQNPPAEALRLLEAARAGGLDAVFGRYRVKEHAAWRNWGSRAANRVASWLLPKPPGLYLSSFRCLSRFVVDQVVRYEGPYPYVDGLILQATRHVGEAVVGHRPRTTGRSGYTLRKLARLASNMALGFSVVPLRIATVLGLAMGLAGLGGLGVVAALYFTGRGPAFGWGSLMAALLVFSGAQMVVLGLIGEYLGRAYLTASRAPQAVVRDVWKKSR